MVEQAVILAEMSAAAGSGEAGDPRRTLLGLSLLGRMVLALAHGGIRHILVLGREGGELARMFPPGDNAVKRSGADVRLAAPGEATLPLPGAPFLLLGGMVVFGAELARRLRQAEADGDRVLAQDSSRFTGLALCRATSFPRLLAEASSGLRPGEPGSFLAGAALLAEAGHGWVAVNSRPAAGKAVRLLQHSLGKPTDGFISRHLNRRVSWPVSRLLVRLGARPNVVTWANLALGLLSGWLVGRGGYGATLAAGLLFQLVSILDGCDGEIARLTFRFTDFGTRLDNLCDWLTLLVFFANLPAGLYAATADGRFLLLGGLAMALLALLFLLFPILFRISGLRGNAAGFIREVQGGVPLGESPSRFDRLGALWGTRLGFIYRKEFISLYAMAWCLAGRAEMILWTTIVIAPLGIVFLAQLIRRTVKSAGVSAS